MVEPECRADGTKHANRKRKNSANGQGSMSKLPRYPCAIEQDDMVDDDEEHLFKQEPGTEFTFTSGAVIDAGYDGFYDISNAESLRERKFGKRSETGMTESMVTISTLPVNSDTRKIRAGHVELYVGNPEKIFIVKKENLEQSTLLVDLIRECKGEYYILSPLLSDIDTDDFGAVVEYLDHYEYKPNLLDEGTDYARLEGIETPQQRSASIIQCAVLYGIGNRLMLPHLSALAIRKFKALAPYIPDDFLIIACVLYHSGPPKDETLHRFFVEYIADNFFELWQMESETFRLLLQEQKELAIDIFARKGKGAELYEPVKVQVENEVKEEKVNEGSEGDDGKGKEREGGKEKEVQEEENEGNGGDEAEPVVLE